MNQGKSNFICKLQVITHMHFKNEVDGLSNDVMWEFWMPKRPA